MLTHWHITDESSVCSCPCGAYAVLYFALPTSDRKLKVFGTCPSCYEAGREPTTVATSLIDYEDWKSLKDAIGFVVIMGGTS